MRDGAGEERSGDDPARPLRRPRSSAPRQAWLFDTLGAMRIDDPLLHACAGVGATGLAGCSGLMAGVRDEVALAARGRGHVLLLGATGTGKELVARAIHAAGGAARPFVPLNCAALTEDVLASELFGHERGAFTGAHRRTAGKFEQAHGGTLFLDEIGDMSPKTQAAVLRALQEGEFDRVGGETPVRVAVRVVAATNKDLRAAVADGRLRADLWYRLAGGVVRLPRLCDRRADIPCLVAHYLGRFRAAGYVGAAGLGGDAMAELAEHDWPGSVRELWNVLDAALTRTHMRALVDARTVTEIIDAHAVDPACRSNDAPVAASRAEPTGAAAMVSGQPARFPRLGPRTSRAGWRSFFRRFLDLDEQLDGNLTAIARALGRDRGWLPRTLLAALRALLGR